MPTAKMTREEIDRFLSCARVGRIGLTLNNKPYVVPLGFGYDEGKVFFHTCSKGLKMSAIRGNPLVCFEVDEALSDVSMYRSVIMLGKAEIVEDKEAMIPYLQKLINKYRVPLPFDEYMRKPGRDKEKELAAVRICVITPTSVTGKKYVAEKEFAPQL
ncbi:MAG: pyridoxamine 5'-phosphate oxidase family protein [Candidatus Bathyarchaeia archaeon]